MRPTALGQRVLSGWASIPSFAPFVTLDAFVLMPGHVHGLLLFGKDEPSGPPQPYEDRFGPQRQNLASVLRGFKFGVTTLPAPNCWTSTGSPAFTTVSCAPTMN